jgi:hypothetical protein
MSEDLCQNSLITLFIHRLFSDAVSTASLTCDRIIMFDELETNGEKVDTAYSKIVYQHLAGITDETHE